MMSCNFNSAGLYSLNLNNFFFRANVVSNEIENLHICTFTCSSLMVLEQFQSYKQTNNNVHTHILICIPSSDIHLLGENVNIRKGNFEVNFRW